MQTIYAYSYNPTIATGTNTTGTNWRMAYQQPIMLYKGTSNAVRLVVFNVNQKIVNLTGYNVQVQLVDRETQEHFVTKLAVVSAPTSGVATITFNESDLRNLEHRFYHLIARLVNPEDGSSITASEILYLDDNYGAFTTVTVENAWNYAPGTISTVEGPLLTVGNIIPAQNDTYWLGNVTNQWHSFYTNLANIGALSTNQISTVNSSIFRLIANTQILEFTDQSTDPNHNVGDGAFLTFFDDTHQNDGPQFETWYGEEGNQYDPPGQHSLDIRAAPNSYVELASHDLNSFVGIDDIGPFIQTQWLDNPSKAWRFLGDGELRLPSIGSKITSENGKLQIIMNFDDIRFVRTDNDGSTLHTTIYDTNGDIYTDGDLLPGSFDPDPVPIHSLGSPSHPWKDIYLSNSTIYIGNIPISINEDNNLLVNGNVITGGTELSVSDFGRGFTDELDSGKITTSKLYNRPDNQGLNNHFVLEVTNGGVVVLPDQSRINGATLKSVAGNYAGITAGPVGKDEDSWVWVDGDGAWIGTKYNTNQKLWKFDNDGNLTVPGDIQDTNGSVIRVATTSTAPTRVDGQLWFNSEEGRTYIKYNGQWVDASPTVLAPPDTNPTLESVTFNDATVQTTAWSGSVSYNNITDKPTFVGGGDASTWLTAG
jgi:hypothetical protein